MPLYVFSFEITLSFISVISGIISVYFNIDKADIPTTEKYPHLVKHFNLIPPVEYSKALEAYKKALNLNPNNYRIYLGLSYCYERAKQYDYALTYGKHALKRAQTNEQKADCNQQIGISYAERYEAREVIKDW